MENELKPNEGKKIIIEVDGVKYERLPIRTHLITDKDDIVEVAEQYGKPGDLVLGANIAGFTKVANAMLWQGVC